MYLKIDNKVDISFVNARVLFYMAELQITCIL